jgi:DNA-binding response OmpR family regulator
MPITALVVDDSRMTAQIIQYHLDQIGCKVVGEASNAAEGLKLFRELKPDIVTLDLMMPKIEGIDSLMMLHTMKAERPEVVVVVVSVVPFEKTQNDFLKEGAMAYLVKPINQYSFDPVRVKLVRAFPELGRAYHPGA